MFEIRINGKESIDKFFAFEKTIEFRYKYGFYGHYRNPESNLLIITINSGRKTILYKIIMDWIKKTKIPFKLRQEDRVIYS